MLPSEVGICIPPSIGAVMPSGARSARSTPAAPPLHGWKAEAGTGSAPETVARSPGAEV